MNHLQRATVLAALLFTFPSLGQVIPGDRPQETWLPLVSVPSALVDVRYQAEWTPTGCQIQFKNCSSVSIHFGFFLEGIQFQESVPINGRVHLLPGKEAAPFIKWVGPFPAVSPIPQLVNIRVEEDEGPFLQ